MPTWLASTPFVVLTVWLPRSGCIKGTPLMLPGGLALFPKSIQHKYVFVALIPVAASVPDVGRFTTVIVPPWVHHAVSRATATFTTRLENRSRLDSTTAPPEGRGRARLSSAHGDALERARFGCSRRAERSEEDTSEL